ncbi:MAG: YncE family protein [Mycobacterium sp.]
MRDAVDVARVGRGAVGDLARSGGLLVATSFADNIVSLIDPVTRTIQDVTVDGEPFAVAVTDDRAYVAMSSDLFDGVAVIDLQSRTVIADYTLAAGVVALAVSPDGKQVFAGHSAEGSVDVAVIDVPAERVSTIHIASGAAISIDALAVDHTGHRLYVATTDEVGSHLVVVDTATARLRGNVVIGAPIRSLALGPDSTAYVLTSDLCDRGELHLVDLAARRVTGRYAIGDAPTQLVLSTDGARAYIVDYDRVTVFCTLNNQIVDTIYTKVQPSCLAVSGDGSRLYVADCAGDITAVAVSAPKPLLYSQFEATRSLGVAEARALEPAGV